MALRRILVIIWLSVAVEAYAQAKRFPLEDRSTYLITIGTDAPTTVVFPASISALDSANVGSKPEEGAPVMIAHTPGATFFTVRATKPGAQAAINVIYQGRAYALSFITGAALDRTVTFVERAPDSEGNETHLSVSRWLNLLDRAKAYPELAQQYPAIAQAIDRATPNLSEDENGLRVVLEEVFRFNPEDTLVFKVRFENRGTTVVRYRTDGLEVVAGKERFPVSFTDASGEVPPGGATQAFLAITGGPDGSRAALTVHNRFAVEFLRTP